MQVSMPSASTSTFIRRSSSMSSLSHSMKVRSSIAALPTRHHLVEQPARQHEAADMLREMARKAEQFRMARSTARRIIGLAGSSPAWLTCGLADLGAPAAPDACWRARGDVLGQAQRLADLADGAARPVAR
jgi:hypothetical protein